MVRLIGSCLEKKIKKKEMGEGANGNCQSQLKPIKWTEFIVIRVWPMSSFLHARSMNSMLSCYGAERDSERGFALDVANGQLSSSSSLSTLFHGPRVHQMHINLKTF